MDLPLHSVDVMPHCRERDLYLARRSTCISCERHRREPRGRAKGYARMRFYA